MLDACLKNKIIHDFLNNYKQKKWNNIIPSLLEIAILNLYSSFKRYSFTEEDFSLIIDNLKSKCFIPSKNSKNKKTMNNNFKDYNYKEKSDIDIPKFRRNLKLNLQDYLQGKNDSYRSFTKKPKNINELNIYRNNFKDNSRTHIYNRSSVVTPIKDLINYNETDISIGENHKIFNVNNKIIRKNNRKINNNNNNKKIMLYNTIEHYDANDKHQNLFNSTHNNKIMNYSYSINDNKKDKNKNYIKVNKNKKKNNNSHLKINVNGEENEKKKSNRYISKTDMNNKIYRINKITKLKIINDYKKKHKNNFNFNKEQILKINEIKNNLNSINNNKEKNHIKNLSETTDNSMLYNSPKNNFEFKGISKLQKYINNHIQININKNNKNYQISNIKRNIKEIILNRDNRKDNRKDNSANNDLLDDINNSISNVNETNISYSIGNNNNIFKMNEQSALLIKNSRKKRIINYNSFNNSKNSKHSISLNDPHLFFKSPKTKNFTFVKQNKNNENGSIEKIK